MKLFFIRQNIYVVLIIVGFLLLQSCKEEDRQQILRKDPGIQKHIEKGPIKVLLSTDKSEITIAERLTLSLTITTDENDKIQWPVVNNNMDQFSVIDYHTTQPELVDTNRKKIIRSYVLEPFLAGEYKIPPIKMIFGKTGQGNNKKIEIETEELTISVTSLLPDTQMELKPHDIKPPVEIPRSIVFWAWIAAIIVVLLIIIIFCFVLLRRRRKNQNSKEISLSAHEIALSELEDLAIPMKMEKKEVKLFYQKISDILRKYIENRFGVNAPEQTTEEFLMGMNSRNVVMPVHKPLLRKFLVQCDLVKFAEHSPIREDINETFEKCKHFIIQTKQEQAENTPPQGGNEKEEIPKYGNHEE
jgi:preprotein translocase subunit SecG